MLLKWRKASPVNEQGGELLSKNKRICALEIPASFSILGYCKPILVSMPIRRKKGDCVAIGRLELDNQGNVKVFNPHQSKPSA